MIESQHLPEITVPDIEITEGWKVSEVETLEDCEDAFSYLMSAVAEIEYQLEIRELGVAHFPDPMWPARARRALKYKKAALQLLNHKRGRLSQDARKVSQDSRDHQLLDHIRGAVSPLQFHQWIVGSGVDRIEAESAA